MSSVVIKSIASAHGTDAGIIGAGPPVDADMRHVLDMHASMSPDAMNALDIAEARARPTLAVAMDRLLRGREDRSGVDMEMRMIAGAEGEIRARVYRPAGTAAGAGLPIILYLHGGLWVTGDLEAYRATPRALAERCHAVVVAAHCRQAPEHRFPAAHQDALAAWSWTILNAEALGGDPRRAAIAGEDAGGNMAIDIARFCVAGKVPGRPRHLALVSPIAAAGVTLPSHIENMAARPLSTADLRWAYGLLLPEHADIDDPRLNPSERLDLTGLPPVTLILAGACPLRSEGEALADSLRRCGVWVDLTVYDGVTWGFFGLARVVNKAMFALGQVVRNLNEALR